MSTIISKKMLVNVIHPEEARVAIVHDGRLMELNIEITGKEQIKGNIYKAVVLRVEQSLQAAFIDIGRAKPAFLQMGEIHPDFWQWREDIPEEQRRRRPKIQEILRRGQEIIVQVEKDERDHKGAAVTSYISLPGRYMVLMPGSDSKGISRKVEQESERRNLKEIVATLNIPEGFGYIVRTEAVGRSAEEIEKDFQSLCALYEDIKLKAAATNGAGEIYKDKGLISRFLRDYFSDSIDEVIVDSKDAYKEAKEFFRDTMPKCEKRVKLHREKRPIFSRFQIEEQIDQIYEKRVPLPSGGYLIIEPTEALVSIDVNSGKTSGEKGIEETALKTNLEAVEEVARQLRLRDLGGLIVIDCIDMREKRHDIEVEKTLKNALKLDKARVNVGRISEFGMLEMSRQRIAKTLNDAIHLECPHCEGRGKVKSVEALAVSFLRKVHAAAAKGNVAEVHGGLPLDVAYYLLNRKKRELTQIENDYDIQVTVKGKTSFLMNQLELEVVKREKIEVVEDEKPESRPDSKELPPTESSPILAPKDVVEGEAEGEKKKKKKRRKKKKLPASVDTPLSPEATVVDEKIDEEILPQQADLNLSEAATETLGNIETAEDAVSVVEPPHKKRRRRKRKKPAAKDASTLEVVSSEMEPSSTAPETASEDNLAATESSAENADSNAATDRVELLAPPATAEPVATETDPVKRKGRKSAKPQRRSAKPAATKSEQLQIDSNEPAAAEIEPAIEVAITNDPLTDKKPIKKRAPRKRSAVKKKSEEESEETIKSEVTIEAKEPTRKRRKTAAKAE